jgi:hypothetical protein
MWTSPLIRDYVLGQLSCWPLCICLFRTWIYIFIFVSYGGIWNINPFLTLQSNTNIKEYGYKLEKCTLNCALTFVAYGGFYTYWLLHKICNFNAKSILCLVFILQTAVRLRNNNHQRNYVYVYHLLLTRGWLQHVSVYIGHLQVYYRNTKCLLKLQRYSWYSCNIPEDGQCRPKHVVTSHV